MSTPTWLSAALSNPDVTDICLNGAGGAYIDRGRGMERLCGSEAKWTDEALRDWTLEQIASVGKSWDARHPFVDATLASGHRLHAAFPPLARQGLLVSLRKLPLGETQARWASSPMFRRLVQATLEGDSILISGSTGSGKTTLLCDLISELPLSERIIALEDTPELAPRHPHFLSLTSRPPNADGCGEVTLRTLLKQTLRMRPDRVVLGECRGAEVLELLQALNTGHRGAMGTLHANSPRDALRRAELLCLIASNGAIPLRAIRELLANGIQWVVQVRRVNGSRVISEVARVEGCEGDTILMRPMVDLGSCQN